MNQPSAPSRSRGVLFLLLVAGVLALAALPAAAHAKAQESSANAAQESPSTVIKRLAYRDAGEMLKHIGMLRIRASVDDVSNSLIITGEADQVDTAVQLLEALDNAGDTDRSYELVVTILRATPEGTVDVPARLRDVVTRLAAIFPYEGYTVEDVIMARTSVGRPVSAEGTVVGRDRYSFKIGEIRAVDDPSGERRLFLSNLSFTLLARDADVIRASLDTSVELREKQIVVVGKATTQSSSSNGLGALVLLVELSPLE